MAFYTTQLIRQAATPADQRVENIIAASENRLPRIFAQRSDMQETPPTPPIDLPGGPLQEYVAPQTAQPPGLRASGLAWFGTPPGMIVAGLAALGLGIGGVYLWRKYSR